MLCLRFLLLAAACAITAPGAAQSAPPVSRIGFTLRTAATPERLHLTVRTEPTNMAADYAASALIGLDTARLTQNHASVGFAMVREPGRLDCAGASTGAAATGDCRFTTDPTFAAFLASHGIRLRDEQQSLELALTGATRELVQALADAHYPAPTADELAGMAALGVTRGYIVDLAAHGYRPERADTLLEFKAIGVTGEYILGIARSGYRALSPEEIVQFRALGVSPAYLGELAAAGYAALSADEVVQLRALNVTRGTIEDLSRAGYRQLPVDRLVEMSALRNSRAVPPAPEPRHRSDEQ